MVEIAIGGVIDGHGAEEIFDFLADSRNELEWNPYAVAVEQVSAGEVGLGTEYRGTYRYVGALDFRVATYDRPSRLGFAGSGERIDVVVNFTLTPAGGVVALSGRLKIEPKGMFRLLGPVLRPWAKREFGQVPRQVMRALEARQG